MDKYKSHQDQARAFLKIASQFQLGKLTTEIPHQKTIELSSLAQNNIVAGINTIKEIDLAVFKYLQASWHELEKLKADIFETLNHDGRIFLCGCGATGRLSLALETIWRDYYTDHPLLPEKIISFMAGGDVALIHSVEQFEDYPEFGKRQLIESGFLENDLLIACTEGGETPFVIGASLAALDLSKRAPYFLYCNPDEILMNNVDRSKKIIENKKIKKINLTVGPQALTGSTRMQASTVLMAAVGLCLCFYNRDISFLKNELQLLIDYIEKTNFDFLKNFIECESQIYKDGAYLFYETDERLGISILTDTTERSPTFSLYPFENQNDLIKNPSLAHLLFKNSKDNISAWTDLLHRPPRTFSWPEVTNETSLERLLGFDFSQNIIKARAQYLTANHFHFTIYYDQTKNLILFSLKEHHFKLNLKDLSFLSVHLILKIILNNLSTLIMGRLDRYESNLMTWVRPNNNKLIDRAVRYALILLKQKGQIVSYEELVYLCFKLKEQIPKDQSMVKAMVDFYHPFSTLA